LKERAKISRPRFHQLEEHELRKLAFTGESYDPYDMNPQVKARKDQILGMKKAKMSEASIKNKIAQNANSSMETQPVCSMKLAGDATTGNLSLPKVKQSI
jgi:hypothetical protein